MANDDDPDDDDDPDPEHPVAPDSVSSAPSISIWMVPLTVRTDWAWVLGAAASNTATRRIASSGRRFMMLM